MAKKRCGQGLARYWPVVLTIATLLFSGWGPVHAATTYHNPILPGDYSDPSLLRVGPDYYMVCDSLLYTPGLLIWHSRDLVHWAPVTYALKAYDGHTAAPHLAYYRSRFYIYYTSGQSTHVVVATNIAGPWSKPLKLKRHGVKFAAFDPSFITNRKGTPYLVGAGTYVVRLAANGLSVVGKRHYIYHGWPIPKNWDVECSCLESPKIIYHHDFYYMVSAEGGTSGPPTSHMAVVARSPHLFGPWKNSPFNPLVHTYSRHDIWWSTGHGSLIATPDHKWYIVFHGYRKHFLTIGRSVLMEPVRWTNSGWLKLLPGSRPSMALPYPGGSLVSGRMPLSDNFSGTALGPQWQFYGPVPPGRCRVANHSLTFRATGRDLATSGPLLCMAVAKEYAISADVTAEKGNKAGLVLFYNPSEYINVGIGNGHIWFGQHGHMSAAGIFTGNRALVKIFNDHNAVQCFIGKSAATLRKVGISLYVGGYTHQTFGQYLSLRPGLYSVGKNAAVFRNFQYKVMSHPIHSGPQPR